MHTYFAQFSMFDLDVTFETKSSVDIKEALHSSLFNELLYEFCSVRLSLTDHSRKGTPRTLWEKSLTSCRDFEWRQSGRAERSVPPSERAEGSLVGQVSSSVPASLMTHNSKEEGVQRGIWPLSLKRPES